MSIVDMLGKAGIVPVIVIEDEAQAVPLAKALVKGGLPVLEVTFRTKAAAGAIAAIRREVPDAIVGAGTLLTVEQLRAAKAAGMTCIGFKSPHRRRDSIPRSSQRRRRRNCRSAPASRRRASFRRPLRRAARWSSSSRRKRPAGSR